MRGKGKREALMQIHHADILGLLKYAFQVWKEAGGGVGACVCLRTHTYHHKICLTYFCFLPFCAPPFPLDNLKNRRVLLINDEGPELSHQVYIYNGGWMEARQCLGWRSSISQLSMYCSLSKWMFLNSLLFFFFLEALPSSILTSQLRENTQQTILCRRDTERTHLAAHQVVPAPIQGKFMMGCVPKHFSLCIRFRNLMGTTDWKKPFKSPYRLNYWLFK